MSQIAKAIAERRMPAKFTELLQCSRNLVVTAVGVISDKVGASRTVLRCLFAFGGFRGGLLIAQIIACAPWEAQQQSGDNFAQDVHATAL
eukprot:1160637-Amphidinium_carterae.1